MPSQDKIHREVSEMLQLDIVLAAAEAGLAHLSLELVV
jgi:hypothetical protein